MRYLMTFSYDGTDYYGYQKQFGRRTIQGEIEDKLFKLNGNNDIYISASGRTDAHVHAINQKAHFDIEREIDVEKFRHSLNSLLDKSIYIKTIEKVDDDFHARYCVSKKYYIYKINMGDYNAFERNYVYQYNKELDVDSIKKAIPYLIGTHDYKSFTKAEKEKDDFIRAIYSIDIDIKDNILIFRFVGNGFLRYMVRNIVGTLIEIGENKRVPEDMKIILDKNGREYAGKIAPACGLYLYDVEY